MFTEHWFTLAGILASLTQKASTAWEIVLVTFR